MRRKLFITIPPVGPPCEASVTSVGVIKALGCECGCASKFKMYVSSILLASAMGMGLNETRRCGGGALGTVIAELFASKLEGAVEYV